MIGLRGTLTLPTRGKDGPGEVEVRTGGGSETYIAYSDESLAKGTLVVVYDTRAGRCVDVAPT
jgi:hypothetical protein